MSQFLLQKEVKNSLDQSVPKPYTETHLKSKKKKPQKTLKNFNYV